MPDLTRFLALRTRLPPAEIEWLRSAGERRVLHRGNVFCRNGQSRHELAFVHEGILQVYAVATDGRHAVLDFVYPGMTALALRSAVAGLPSEVCIEAVTRCVLTVWPYALREAAFKRHPGWACLEARLTEEMFVRKQQRDLSLRTRNARERYLDLDRDLPNGGAGIPKRLLASFLAMTPQYFSRLRHEERRQELVKRSATGD